MDESKAIEYLMHFGMSRQEATVYLRLIEAGKQTGYEIARDTGISRSNVYASLAALVEKGGWKRMPSDIFRFMFRSSVVTESAEWKKNRSGWI